MSTPTFAELLTYHLNQTGISDSELARSIGVRRQTVFRWKEGLVERPRAREDVLRCAQKLRLTPSERDLLLLAAGFAPEALDPATVREQAVDPPTLPVAEPLPSPAAVDALPEVTDEALLVDDDELPGPDTVVQAFAPVMADATGRSPSPAVDPTPALPAAVPLQSSVQPVPTLARLLALPRRWLVVGGGLMLVAFVVGISWVWGPNAPPLPTPTPAVVKVTLNPPNLPVEYPVALAGETLLVVAPFAEYTTGEGYNVAGRIQDALTQEIATAGLLSTTIAIWPEAVRNANQVRQLVGSANAALVIWGEYDSGRVRVNWTVGDQATGQEKTEKVDFALTSPSELITTINTRLPQEIRSLALTALGRVLRDQGDRTRALAAFRRALELDPEDDKTRALLNFYLGHLTEQSRTLVDFDRAISYYTAALQSNGQLVDAYYNRGTIYLNRSALLAVDDPAFRYNLERAIADLSQVLRARPNSLNGYLNRGVAYYERNGPDDMSRAAADFSQIIALQPDHARAYFHRGLVGVRTNTAPGWIEDFTKTLELQPDYYPALNGLCWGYALAEQPEQALPLCDEAVQLDPTGASRDGRGIVYTQLGRLDNAIADFNAYLAWAKDLTPTTLYGRYRGPLVEAWITQLQAGANPFTPDVLAALR